MMKSLEQTSGTSSQIWPIALLALALIILPVFPIVGCTPAAADSTPGDLPPQSASATETPQPTRPLVTDTLASQIDYSQPGVPASSIGSKDHRLEVVFENQRIALKNGGKINLGDGLSMEVFITPYPPAQLTAWLDLYLTRQPDDQPIKDAEISMEYDMLYMYHGPFKVIGDNLGDGHYLFTMDYLMYGPWDQGVEIRLPDKRYKTVLIVIAYPLAER
jgi:hypothetical protein